MSTGGFEEKLIEMVKEKEILYNKKCGGFKNIAKKAEIWQNISITLGQPVSDCMTRWKTLRDRYMKISKEKKNIPSGSEYKFKAEWEFYPMLSFLADHIQFRRTVGNFSAVSTSSNMSIIIEEDEIYVEPDEKIEKVEKTTKKRQKTNVEEIGGQISTAITALGNYVDKKSSNSNTNINNNFSVSMDVLLSNLTPENRTKAEKKIMEFLCKAQLENLKNGDVDNVKM